MFSKLLLTFRYLFSVKGYRSIPTNSLPARMGCKASDRFSIALSEAEYPGGVSLAEFHAAFLCSPVFSMELWILKKILSPQDAATIGSKAILRDVAMGDRSRLGPWTAWAVEGSRTRAVVSSSAAAAATATPSSSSLKENKNKQPTACQIMQCRINNRPFCDTWWAVELEEDTTTTTVQRRHPQLVFGTSMIQPIQPLLWKLLLDPLHRLYSRLLLASAKATLVDAQAKKYAAR